MNATNSKGNTAKQVKINETTRKHTLEIYDKLIVAIRGCWEKDADTELGKETVAGILYQYSRKDGKEAVTMILEDDMDIFKGEKKQFRIYAQNILHSGKQLAKERIKANNEAVARMVDSSKRMKEAFATGDKEHVFGTGMKRFQNEIRNRPRFLMEDLKFKVLRAIGVY